jgi:large subunit ribosomal protein L13
MKTYSAKPSEIQRDWVVLDATGVPVGRLAAEAAKILRGKHKPTYTPNVDTGDHVIIINAERAIYTGNNKPDEPIYHHTHWPGGLKMVPKGEFLSKRPEDAIKRTIWKMLPHNSLGTKQLTKLRVYRGSEHPHEAQIKGMTSTERVEKTTTLATRAMRRRQEAGV